MTTTTPLPLDRPLGGPFRGLGVVFLWGLRRTFAGKRAWIGILLAGGAGALLGASTGIKASDPLARLWGEVDGGMLRTVAPLIALLMVAQGFAAEVRGGTLLYHLVRPVPRHVVFLGRFASGWIGGLVAVAALVVGTAVTASRSVPLTIWLQLFVVMLFTVTALGALYYTLSALLRRGLIAGLIYTFVIEVLLGSMPGSIQKASVNHHARGMFHGWCDGWFAENSRGVKEVVSRASGNPMSAFTQVDYDEPLTAMIVLLCIAAGCLLFGAWRIRNRDFALKD